MPSQDISRADAPPPRTRKPETLLKLNGGFQYCETNMTLAAQRDAAAKDAVEGFQRIFLPFVFGSKDIVQWMIEPR